MHAKLARARALSAWRPRDMACPIPAVRALWLHLSVESRQTGVSTPQNAAGGTHEEAERGGRCARAPFGGLSLSFLCHGVRESDAVWGLTVHLDASVRLWDVRTAQLAHEISRVHKQPITSVCLVPNKEHGRRPASPCCLPCCLILPSWCCGARSKPRARSLCRHLDRAAVATSQLCAPLLRECGDGERGCQRAGRGVRH